MSELDTTELRAWHTQDPHDLGGRCIRRDCDRGPWPCDMVRLCNALDRQREETARLRAARDTLDQWCQDMCAERDDARARLDEIAEVIAIRQRQVVGMEPGAEALANQIRAILD